MKKSIGKPDSVMLPKGWGFVLACLVLSHSVHATPLYALTDLGTFGGANSIAAGINDKGQIVGSAEGADGAPHAFRSTRRGKKLMLTRFSNADERLSYGTAINASGQISGNRTLSQQGSARLRALWEEKSGKTFATASISGQGFRSGPRGSAPHLKFIPPRPLLLDTPQGQTDFLDFTNICQGINDSGQMAGLTTVYPQRQMHAFRSRGNASKLVLTDLGTLGGPSSAALGINGQGQVVGTSEITQSTPNPVKHAFRSSANGEQLHLQDLGTLGGPNSNAQSINGKGQVTGDAQLADLAHHAFRSSGNGEELFLLDLGTLGGKDSYGMALNDNGKVVGHSSIAVSDEQHGFLYDGELHDLNDLISNGTEWTIVDATGINGRDEIAAIGVRSNGRRHALLLTPSAQ